MIEGESSGEDENKKFKVKVNLKSRNILAAKKVQLVGECVDEKFRV